MELCEYSIVSENLILKGKCHSKGVYFRLRMSCNTQEGTSGEEELSDAETHGHLRAC